MATFIFFAIIKKMHFRLDKPALELLLEWFFDFPEERIHETLVHGIDFY